MKPLFPEVVRDCDSAWLEISKSISPGDNDWWEVLDWKMREFVDDLEKYDDREESIRRLRNIIAYGMATLESERL